MRINYFRVAIIIVVLIIGTMSMAYASETITAVQNKQIRVTLDGMLQTFSDETTGERQYPITYNDRTYLPLRNIAQLVGLEVDYDANTNTAILKSSKNSTTINSSSAVQTSVDSITVSAIQNTELKVSLDGVVQTFKDEATGEIQYPITYNDRTYLPLRNIATLVGIIVDYDGNTNTAILKTSNFKEEKVETTTSKNDNRFASYDNAVKSVGNDRSKRFIGNVEYKDNTLYASYIGDVKFETSEVEQALKTAKSNGSTTFTLKNSYGNEITVFTNGVFDDDVKATLDKKYSNYLFVRFSVALVKENDGYYLKLIVGDSILDMLTVTEKGIVSFPLNENDDIQIKYTNNYDLYKTWWIENDPIFKAREITGTFKLALLKIENNSINCLFDTSYDYLRIDVNAVSKYESTYLNRYLRNLDNFSSDFENVTMKFMNEEVKYIMNSEEDITSLTKAQKAYAIANGLKIPDDFAKAKELNVPVGYKTPEFIINKIQGVFNNIAPLLATEADPNTVSYVIEDSLNESDYYSYKEYSNNEDGSAGFELYGDMFGKEYHFMTSDLDFYTLPGYRFLLDDGSIRYYIYALGFYNDVYYTTKGFSNLKVGDENIKGDIIESLEPIQASNLKELGTYGLDSNNAVVTDLSKNYSKGYNTIIK